MIKNQIIADRFIKLTGVYGTRIQGLETDKKALEATSHIIVAGRLLLFLLTGILIYLSVTLKNSLILPLPLATLAGFLFLVKKSVAIRREINFCQILIRINQDEIKALNGDYSAFDPGHEFQDFRHEYSFDLDIFGNHSIYRMINRTATPPGREKLADRLLQPGTDTNLIRQRQEAVKELSEMRDWRQNFLATARESDWEKEPGKQVRAWLNAPDHFSKSRFYSIAIYVNAFITIILTSLALLNAFLPFLFTFTPPPALFTYFILPIGLIISRARLINREQQKLERQLDLFRKYAGLLQLIENEPFKTKLLIDLKESLMHENVQASLIMKKLTGILWGLEVRGNLIVSFLLNSFFLWDILLMIRLEKWRHNYRDSFGHWINAIAEFEILNSLATFAYNRSDLTWPEIREGGFHMEIENGGHPMIDPQRRIDNSLNFNDQGRIYLITGANMAGKSTLLRMVGVNMILAMAGGPVCASRFALVPVSIHTSVRTNDSLGDDESYFYAELKKLSRIIKRSEEHENLFVIIDEMLKGTNSRDKHTGSAALIRRLIELGTSGLVATHDVELGDLEADYPGYLANRCFEVNTDDGQLKFDYLLYNGVSKSLNATFLMKQMGIIKA